MLEAINVKEVQTNEHDGYLFIHKDIEHTEDFDLYVEATKH